MSPQLANPVNDSAKIAATLKEAGFDVVDSRRDLPAAETRRALRDFADRARDADIAVVYYAGHGIEVDGSNYLIPVDAKLERDTDVYDEALSLDRVLIAIEPAKKLRLVILDACRDNPFAKSMKRTVASRAIGQGLAKVEPTSPNVLIAYSAKAGSPRPMATARTARSRRRWRTTSRRPGSTCAAPSDLSATKCSRPPATSRSRLSMARSAAKTCRWCRPRPRRRPPRAAPALSAQAEARRDYELALQLGNKSALDAFLKQYPDGFYASLAKLQLDKIAAEEIRVAATEKARLAEQERARLVAEGAQKSAAVEGRGRRQRRRTGAYRRRKGQAGCAGPGRCRRTEARRG